MKFCEECGSVMKIEDDEWVCTQCGHTEPRAAEEEAAFVTTERQRDAEVIETEQEASFEGKPTATDVTCEECGHHEAWYTLAS